MAARTRAVTYPEPPLEGPLEQCRHQRREVLDDAVQGGHMPPILVTHDGSCGDFKDEATLTAEEPDVTTNGRRGAISLSLYRIFAPSGASVVNLPPV